MRHGTPIRTAGFRSPTCGARASSPRCSGATTTSAIAPTTSAGSSPALPDDARFRERVDTSRLALVGHSLGGYTVLGLGGAWPSWKLDGVRAILALTPYSLPFQRSEGLRKLRAPVMYQAGTLDQVFTLPLNVSGYDQSPAPKYFVEFATAAHLAWTDLWVGGHDEIVDYTLAFFDHYVKGTTGERDAAHEAARRHHVPLGGRAGRERGLPRPLASAADPDRRAAHAADRPR